MRTFVTVLVAVFMLIAVFLVGFFAQLIKIPYSVVFWGRLVLWVLFMLVFVYYSIRKVTTDPPHKAVLVFWGRRQKKVLVVWITGVVVLTIGITGFICLIYEKWLSTVGCFGLFTVLVVFFGVGGLKQVHQEERMVVELFGKFYGIKKPGLRWVCPIIMSVRAVVPIWEQTLDLFKEPIKIDFKDGSAAPKGVEAFVRVKDPGTPYFLAGEKNKREGVFRVIYYTDNWRNRAVDLLENAVRSYLATLTIDEALPQQRGGYDLLTVNRLPEEERGRIQKAMAQWGLILERITVTDFDLEPELVQARGQVQIRQRQAEVAHYEVVIRSQETAGVIMAMMAQLSGQSVEKIQERIQKDSALQNRLQTFLEDLVSRQTSIAGKSLNDIRVSGAGDFGNALLTLITALRKKGE